VADRTVSVKLRAEVGQYTSKLRAAGAETEKFGKSTERVASRANTQWNLLLAAVTGGAPVAAAAGIAAAVGGAATAFAGLGAVALRNNTEIRKSFEDLSESVQSGLAQDASVLQDEFVGAAERIGQAYQGLRPQLQQAFSAAQPMVGTLTEGVIDFAENAMPGMVTAVERSGPVMDGFRSLLADTGSGVSEFFAIVSEGSDDTGEGLENLGVLLRGFLVETGGLLGNLSGLWAEHGAQIADVFNGIIGTFSDLTGDALPVFSTSIGVALDVLEGFLAVVRPLSGVLGPLIGTWLSLAAAIKGIGAVRSVLGTATTAVTGFGQSMTRAEGRARAFKLAGAALALGVDTAARSMAAINPEVDALDEGLSRWVRTGKASGEAARVLGADMEHLALGLTQVNASGFEKFLGGLVEGIPVVGAAVQNLDSSFARGTERIEALDDALANMVTSGNAEGAAEAVRKIAQETGKSIEEVKEALPGYSAAIEQAAAKSAKLGTTAFQSRPGVDALEESLATLADQTADTADKADALNDAWKRLFGITLTMEEAQAAFEGGLDDIAESIQGVKEETADWQGQLLNANGSINLTTEAGRALSEQLIAQGEDYRTLAQTAYDTALSQGRSQQEATAAAVAATTERRNQFISEMRQMGFNAEQARTLANRYFGIPGDVTTLIRDPGMASAIAAARQLTSAYDRIPRHVRTVIETVMPGPFGVAMAGARVLGGGRAAGGEIRGPGTGTSDTAGLFALSNGEHVWTAAEVRAVGGHAAMEQMRAAALGGRGMADGGAVRAMANGGAVVQVPSQRGGVTVVNNYNLSAPNYVGSQEQLVTTLRKSIANSGGGNVQKFLGRS
jgi:DNA-binding transcriptional MerR regulator